MRARVTCLVFVVVAAATLRAQVESPVLVFNRGILWHSVFFAKVGPNFSNWARRGIGLDWPGFDETWIREDVGGAASYLVTGGFYVGARKTRDTVLAVEDWSMYATTVSSDPGAKYRVTRHRQRFQRGQNYWLASEPLVGEEVIETEWEYNLNYSNLDDRERQLPVRVRRAMHQWNGSRRDESYVLSEYVITNISPELQAAGRDVPDTLFGVHLLLNYALHTNARSWFVLFPSYPAGARNSWFFYDAPRRMIWARAGDYRDTPGRNEEFGYSGALGPYVGGEPSGEWLAPGFVGLRLLYSTPDSTGQATRVHGYGWSAADNSIDLSGPFTGLGTIEARYQVLANPANATRFVRSSSDTVYMQRSRMWSLMSLGPWTILPGDSITVAIAELVDGLDYSYAVDPATTPTVLGSRGSQVFFATADKAKFTYDQHRAGYGLNHPDPPPAPAFTVDYVQEREVGNLLAWGSEGEGVPDPDDGLDDLAGYRIYRSSYLPIGPWDSIGVVWRGDTAFYDPGNRRYAFRDTFDVQIGALYYYALTSFDTGRAAWPVNPSAVFPETRSNRVPALESSIFANRTVVPFRATIPASPNTSDVMVVPNPFVVGQGYTQRGDPDVIQFVNLPNPCTIRIYTVRGDLVSTLEVPEGAGSIASWYQISDYGQYIESGIYIFHVDAPTGTKIGKFAIIR